MPSKRKPQSSSQRKTKRRPTVGSRPTAGKPANDELQNDEPPSLAKEAQILDWLADTLKQVGVAGERRAALILYLAVTSRLFARPLSVAVKGPSSAGKSFLVRQVLRMFPDDAFYVLSSMSDRALAYSREPLKHRMLVVQEDAGVFGEMGNYLLRSLLSEGELRYETVEHSPSGLRSRVIHREGPTGLVTTTTAVSLHGENETRLLSIAVDDTAEQTREILRAIASDGNGAAPDVLASQRLQQWLERHGERRVSIPFAVRLADSIRPVATRLRRDFTALLTLVQSCAFLHQVGRPRTPEGAVIATLDDYATVRELVADLLAHSAEQSVPLKIRETVHAVHALIAQRVPSINERMIATRLGLDKSTTSRRIKAAIEAGYLDNIAPKGRPACILLGDPLPSDVEILPTVETLRTDLSDTSHNAPDENEATHEA